MQINSPHDTDSFTPQVKQTHSNHCLIHPSTHKRKDVHVTNRQLTNAASWCTNGGWQETTNTLGKIETSAQPRCRRFLGRLSYALGKSLCTEINALLLAISIWCYLIYGVWFCICIKSSFILSISYWLMKKCVFSFFVHLAGVIWHGPERSSWI